MNGFEHLMASGTVRTMIAAKQVTSISSIQKCLLLGRKRKSIIINPNRRMRFNNSTTTSAKLLLSKDNQGLSSGMINKKSSFLSSMLLALDLKTIVLQEKSIVVQVTNRVGIRGQLSTIWDSIHRTTLTGQLGRSTSAQPESRTLIK